MYETVVKQALPTLCTSIATAKPEETWIAASAIDLVSSLIRGAPESGLGDGFFALLAPSLFSCLGNAEDRDVLQVCIYRDVSGQRVINNTCRMVSSVSH